MAEKIVIQVQADTKDAVKGIDKVDESIKDVNKSSANTANSLDKMTGGAISGFKGITKSIGTAIKGFKSLKFAIAATGIGALVIAITAVGQAFTRSEEGQNKFAKLMGVIGAVTGQFMDAIAGLGDLIIGAFENPKQALTNFANLIKDNIVNRFEGLLELVPQLGKAIGLLFEGKFKEAGKTATNAVAKVSLGVEDIVDKTQQAIDKTNEFIQATVEEGEIAGKIADQRARADKVERDLLVQRAEANRKIAELREIAANKETVTVQERLDAIKEASKVENEITAKEIEAAKLRLEAKQAENALGLSTKADLEEEAQLKARVIELETARLNTQKRLTAELTGAIREQAAEEKAIQAEEDAVEKERKDRIAAEDKERKEKELAEKTEQALLEEQLEQQKRASKMQTVDTIIGLTNKETAIGKAALLAKQFLVAQEFILNAKSQIANAKKTLADANTTAAGASTEVAGSVAKGANAAPPPWNIPFIISAIATGAGIISSVKSAIGATKQAASAVGAGGSTPSIAKPSAPTSAPPAFNLVGAGAGNQLAETIAGQTQQPIKAFVTSQDVTTAQSLERNIVEGASI